MQRLTIVDSHTGGEPTRLVVAGGPDLGRGPLSGRRERFQRDFDRYRSAVVNEPRGSDVLVGALLVEPEDQTCACGVIFFNNVGYLGMCGHGTIGVVRTLEHLGRITAGVVHLDTPVGSVSADLATDGAVTIRNVPSYCHARDVAVEVPGLGRVVGDVAYGGNWFFIVHWDRSPLALREVDELTRLTRTMLAALRAQGVTGQAGAEIDHVELSAAPTRADADSRNFVLCPGGAYDRSPCGTGTSARMASLHARGELPLGARWRQESVTGSCFTGWLEGQGGQLIPHVRGTAYITGESTLRFDPTDPFRTGFTAAG